MVVKGKRGRHLFSRNLSFAAFRVFHGVFGCRRAATLRGPERRPGVSGAAWSSLSERKPPGASRRCALSHVNAFEHRVHKRTAIHKSRQQAGTLQLPPSDQEEQSENDEQRESADRGRGYHENLPLLGRQVRSWNRHNVKTPWGTSHHDIILQRSTWLKIW